MMQNEFQMLIGKTVTVEEYAVIETVYMYHPMITDREGKKQMKQLFETGGMTLISDMFGRADAIRKAEGEKIVAQAAVRKLEKEMEEKLREVREEYLTKIYEERAKLMMLQDDLDDLKK